MARTSLRRCAGAAGTACAIAVGAAVPFVLLGAAAAPAHAGDVDIGPDVQVGPAIEIGPAGTAILPEDIWAMIDENSTLQPPPD